MAKVCSMEACETRAHSRGLCVRHYGMAKRRGTLPAIETKEQRFWAQVEKSDGCWTWTASLNHGYGNFCWDSKVHKAHRVSFELTKGPIPEGLEIDHICRNRSCVRPEHLRAVTRKQNIENHGGARADSKSGIRGVTWHKAAKLWVATFQHNGKFSHLGSFSTKEEAAEVVLAARNAHFTHNEIDRLAA